jgi:hypothetical protein
MMRTESDKMDNNEPEFGLADGIFVFIGAVSLWRAVTVFEDSYFFPDDVERSVMASAAVGFAIMAWKGKDFLGILKA